VRRLDAIDSGLWNRLGRTLRLRALRELGDDGCHDDVNSRDASPL
jgi:hypothetical protein